MFKAGNYWLPDEEKHLVHEYEKGGWQLEHLNKAIKYVKRHKGLDGIAIDGGAHVGSWSKVMAQYFKHVHAFDLTPDNFECLKKNVEEWELSNITLYNVGIGETDEFVGLGEDENWKGNTGGKCVKGEGVLPIKRLDDFNFDNVVFIKLDIEGYEEKALKGAANLIKKYRPVILIEHKARLNTRYGSITGDLDTLQAFEYTQVEKMKSDRLFLPNECIK